MSSLFYKAPFLLFCLTHHCVNAQAIAPVDSSRTIVLHDVAVTDKLARLRLTSGKLLWHAPTIMGPGHSYAVRFAAPRAGYHRLNSFKFLLDNPGQIREGQLRLRAASVAADGGPATDNLLPGFVTITTAELQRVRRGFRVRWPTNRLVVPAGGFFLVIESQFNDSTSYIAGVAPSPAPHQSARYVIQQRGQPTAAARLASLENFPILRRAEAPATGVESWEKMIRGTQWQLTRPNEPIIYVEALFD